MRHFGLVEYPAACLDALHDCGSPVIIALPLLTVEGGGSEHGVDHLWVGAGSESDHSAQGTLRFRLGTVIADVAVVIQPAELLSVFLPEQSGDDIEDFLISVAFLAVSGFISPAHILIQSDQQRVRAVFDGLVSDHIAGKSGKAVRNPAHV